MASRAKTPAIQTDSLLPTPESAAEEVVNNKTEAAYRLLRQAILEARLMPGTPLRQSNLQAAYGIGWTPLREALSRLTTERLVTMQHNFGFAVAPVSAQELDDLTRARRALELVMLTESIERGDSAWEDALVVAHYRLKSSPFQVDAVTGADIDLWMGRHLVFHRCLLAGGASPWLMHLYGQIMDQEHRHHRILLFGPLRGEAGRPAPTAHMKALTEAVNIQHHTDLMEAALARDIPKATALMAEHVRYKGEVFTQAQQAELAPTEAVGPKPTAPRRRRTAPKP